MDNGLSIPELYQHLLEISCIIHPQMREDTVNRINSFVKSNEDTTDITALILALMSYHYNKNTDPITKYPGRYVKMAAKRLYYSDLDDTIIKVLSSLVKK